MIGEVSIYGVFVPWLMVLALVTLPLLGLVRYVLAALGFYRFVWHPALFDTALYLMLLGLLHALSLALPRFF